MTPTPVDHSVSGLSTCSVSEPSDPSVYALLPEPYLSFRL